jgi:preprotein translocase subunit Sss1
MEFFRGLFFAILLSVALWLIVGIIGYIIWKLW